MEAIYKFHVISIEKRKVDELLYEEARKEAELSLDTIDETFKPYIVPDNFGGYKVHIKKKEK